MFRGRTWNREEYFNESPIPLLNGPLAAIMPRTMLESVIGNSTEDEAVELGPSLPLSKLRKELASGCIPRDHELYYAQVE